MFSYHENKNWILFLNINYLVFFPQIEEMVLEGLAWRENSPLWSEIRKEENIPSVEDVSFPNQIERDEVKATNTILSPMMNPALRRVAGAGPTTPIYKGTGQIEHIDIDINW